ncbi:hypothetical protein RHGRI_009475 [Rhododendron griersonianum]|uniref:Bromo domain-containing protein n=1 Tax=Rhododendron griersonianum TaxID=479676 RepID=A0AAV6KFJ7_9ERIC|nr:hypothetical protein RHGRI_009475 [Rhododendron griersonianum]
MSQIVNRKKKGRPSKADLARRAAEEQESDGRGSRRRGDVKYSFDFADFIDEEEERRREKKSKQLLKLQKSNESGGESARGRTRRVEHAPASSSEREDGDGPLKKRKIDGGDEDEEVRLSRRKGGSKVVDSVPEAPSGPPLGIPLPEKSSLELILDKLQKKDTYGVYAEPVDPDELPDYHDVIEHPMDFATVRKKLGNGLYSTLEQFESDLYLICTNAMQYNAPDTIYYKQAQSIQELAKKKFQELRIEVEHNEKELKSGQKPRSNSLAKQQITMPMSMTQQEPVGSDFFSGATLATTWDFQNGSNATSDGGFERLTTADGPVVGNTPLVDNKIDKAEDLQGRVPLSRLGRKAFTHDENRRATYSISNQLMVGSESIFNTFDAQVKQLVAVGIHADHSYARSLALFAATLGPIAWKVASKRIEEAVPRGFKYGRGWVGDYEPLPTPILMPEGCSPKEPVFLSKTNVNSTPRKDDKTSNNPLPIQKQPGSFGNLQGKPSLVNAAVTKPTVSPAESAMVSAEEPLECKQPFFSSGRTTPTMSANVNYQQQSPLSRSNDSGKKFLKQLELNCTPISANQNTCSSVAEKQLSNGLDVPASQLMENVSRNSNLLQPVPLKQPENHGLVAGGLLTGKLISSSLDRNRKVVSSSDSIPKQMVMSATYIPHGPDQGLSDPAQLMRMLDKNAEKQQTSFDQSVVYNPSVMPPVPSSKRDDSNNASAAAAQAWMSMGSGMSQTAPENRSGHKNQIFANSLYNNPTRELQQRVPQFQGDFPNSVMQFQLAKTSFPFQAIGIPPVQMGNETHFQNRETNFPPSAADLSRFQMQSPWQGLNSHRQPTQKQEWVPPDLNIGVQSSGSPVGQSSGVLLDSQHPDLALQL